MCAGETTALVSSAVSPLDVGLSLAAGLSVRSAPGSMAVSGGVGPEQLGRRSQLSWRETCGDEPGTRHPSLTVGAGRVCALAL